MQTNIDPGFFQREINAFIYKRVKDKALADDITHDVYLKVQHKVGQLRSDQKIEGWIYQVTRNAIIDHYRKQARSVVPYQLQWENDTPNYNDCVASYLQRLLPTLPDKYRMVLELAELQGLPQYELAKRLDISYSGAKSRVQRARQLLKQKLEEQLILKMDAYGNAVVCLSRGACC